MRSDPEVTGGRIDERRIVRLAGWSIGLNLTGAVCFYFSLVTRLQSNAVPLVFLGAAVALFGIALVLTILVLVPVLRIARAARDRAR